MSKMFYQKLAVNNIKKNKKYYFPYILTTIGMIAMFYMICSLADNSVKLGAPSMHYLMILGTRVTSVFAVIFLFYTNRFLTKRRTKEFGLYSILGMEKRHISRVIFGETFIIGVLSLFLGLGIGLLLDKAMYLILLKLISFPVPTEFAISIEGIIKTLILFGGIFTCIFIRSMMQIHTSNPIELLKSSDVGEKDPKARHLIGLLGVIFIIAGYYISITTIEPMMAIMLFFAAVLLVVIGTYLTFTAGSISLLKILKKNKTYYYKINNFISISGMIYRMKQNAIGLGNICILSTAVLVMLSTTISLYIGMEDTINVRHPKDMEISILGRENVDVEAFKQTTDSMVEQLGIKTENQLAYKELTFAAIDKETHFDINSDNIEVVRTGKLVNLFFVPQEDYNKWAKSTINLEADEVMVYSNDKEFPHESLKVLDMEFKIKERLDEFITSANMVANVYTTYFIVVKDQSIMETLSNKHKEVMGVYASLINTIYNFDIIGEQETRDAQGQALYKKLKENRDLLGEGIDIVSKATKKQGIYEMYGGFLFIGIFLGTLFIIATILIMYYKQISEGYGDKTRFEIMQKVGMNKSTIKQSISSQVLIVFFLPLITAGLHVAFAMPIIIRLLAMFGLTNIPLFLTASGICFVVFTIFYTVVYKITAKTYYKIVS